MKKIAHLLFLLLSSSTLFAQSVVIEPTGILPVYGAGGTALADGDGNTKLDVEKTSNEDKIRFTTGGKEIAVLDSQTFHLNAYGESVFIGLDAGKNDAGVHSIYMSESEYDNRNVGVGFNALKLNTTGFNNASVGYRSLFANTTGSSNASVGYNTLKSNTTGSTNSGFGNEVLYLNTSGYSNSALGSQSLYANTTGKNNAAMGNKALFYNTTGNNNVAIGSEAGGADTTSKNNVYIGFQAGGSVGDAKKDRSDNVFIGYKAGSQETESDKLYIENTDSDEPLIYGDFDEDHLKVNGILAVRDETRLNGYTSLGNEALTPKIKMKKLMGSFTASTAGGSTYIAHGLADSDRILSVDVAVNWSYSSWVPENYTNTSNKEFNYSYNDTNVAISNQSGNSSDILNKPIRVLITYEE